MSNIRKEFERLIENGDFVSKSHCIFATRTSVEGFATFGYNQGKSDARCQFIRLINEFIKDETAKALMKDKIEEMELWI